MANTNWKFGRPSLTEHIGKVLRDLIDDLGRKPLPERWAQLIERLNAEEDALNERARRETPLRLVVFVPKAYMYGIVRNPLGRGRLGVAKCSCPKWEQSHGPAPFAKPHPFTSVSS